MLLIGFCVPERFVPALKQIADEVNEDIILLHGVEELNDIDIIRQKCVIVFEAEGELVDQLRAKAGANSVIVWYTDQKSAGGPKNGADPIGREYCYAIPENPDDFKEEIAALINNNDIIHQLNINERSLSRLNLLHELTRRALGNSTEPEIVAFVMKRLTAFYEAINCTYLEYADDGDLYIVSEVNQNGVIQQNLNRKVTNKQDYEECIRCGDTIINCKNNADKDTCYLCAPLISGNKKMGLLRVCFRPGNVNIAVDRIVLRVAADILAAAKIRQLTNMALQESEQRATTILDTTVDAIITINERGDIQTYNQAAETLFGYTVAEVKGKNIHVLMPSPYKEEHDDYMNNYKRTGEKQIIGMGREVTGRHKDGSLFPMYLSVSEYRVNGKQMFTGVVRDITEERQLEQEVMRISEHERHRIGQDLHDGLGQMLSGIGLLSHRVANKLQAEDHALSNDMHEIRDLIKKADDYSRGLARGLVKIDLDRGGFSAAIEKLIRQSKRLFRIKCELSAAQDLDITERTRAEHVYRIVQEAINNAVKHGQASEVKVFMLMENNYLRISIKDNGTGFPKDWRSNDGLGVRIMEFRSRLIGAHFEKHNDPDGGAIIICTVPNP